jgi:o-succinylbenzoate---CoA ligase
MRNWLEHAALLHPERIAIDHDSGARLTYRALLERARASAAGQRAGGVIAGGRLALRDDDRLEFAVALHGALILGAACVPIDVRLGPEEQARREVGGPVPYADVATVMYTSGTSSEPKPVYLTTRNWEANAVGSALALGLDPNERWLCVMPLAHVGGLSILLRSALYGTTAVVHQGYDTDAVLAELMSAERSITLVSLVPTMLARLLDAGLANPPTLRWALVGGGPIAPGLLARAEAAGVPVAPSFGMTEGCSQIATFGVPLHGVELAFDDGELIVRGPNIAPNALDPDGWLRTGDLAEIDRDGRLKIVGRKSDTIVSGGENVAPAEVEAALLEHPAVADAGVFAREDAEWGEAVVATVVLRDGSVATEEDLQAFAAGRLARFKVPKQIGFAPELPRTVSGKLLRRELR